MRRKRGAKPCFAIPCQVIEDNFWENINCMVVDVCLAAHKYFYGVAYVKIRAVCLVDAVSFLHTHNQGNPYLPRRLSHKPDIAA